MSSAGFSRPTTIRLQIAADLPGSPSSVTRKTVCTASICSDVNRWHCARTGCWSLWISTLGRIIGFGIHAGIVDGRSLCRMFNRAIRWQTVPKYLSSNDDPLYRFHQWQANLRVLGVTEVKTVPYVPLSHPFVERLIGTIRRELLDHVLFWTAADLESKLSAFQTYYNIRQPQVDGSQLRGMILHKGSPGLRWRFRMSNHVFGDGGLRDFNSKL